MTSHKPIIVIGTGRSGTSIVAKMLIEMGVDMGQKLVPPDENNIHGYFEDLEFAELNDARVLKGMSREEWTNQFEKLLKAREGKLWGWKIPMVLEPFPDIRERLEDSYWINCVRNHTDVVKSVQKGLDISMNHAHRLVDAREQMLKTTAHLNRLDLWFPDIINRPVEVANSIAEFCNLPKANEELIKNIIKQ